MGNPCRSTPSLLCILCLFAAIISVPTVPGHAETVRELIDEGNRAYSTSNYEDAAVAYEKALKQDPESAHALFNKGVAHYASGDFEKAENMFRAAADKSEDPVLDASARYNTGNALFRKAEALARKDPESAVKPLEQSIAHYRLALDGTPEMTEAAENMEVARLGLRALLDEIERRKQQQQKQEEARRNAEQKLEELAQKQEQAAKDGRQLADRPPEQRNPDQARQQAANQQQLQQETQELAEQIAQAAEQQQDGMKDAQHNLEEAMRHQESATDQLRKNKPDTAAPRQASAADELRKALDATRKAEREAPDNEEKQEGEKQDEDQSPGAEHPSPDAEQDDQQAPDGKAVEESEEELDEQARDILDEEKLNRQRRQLIMQGGIQPVEKDW